MYFTEVQLLVAYGGTKYMKGETLDMRDCPRRTTVVATDEKKY